MQPQVSNCFTRNPTSRFANIANVVERVTKYHRVGKEPVVLFRAPTSENGPGLHRQRVNNKIASSYTFRFQTLFANSRYERRIVR